MKEHPILFTPKNIRKIIAGIKTQTRRVITPQPQWEAEVKFTRVHGPLAFPIGAFGQQCGYPLFIDGRKDGCTKARNPCGTTGNRLWVKEGVITHISIPQVIGYVADGYIATESWEKRRTAMMCPRWASRITLEIVDVRVQRLHDINIEDAVAEGCLSTKKLQIPEGHPRHPREQYARLWDSINEKHGFGWCKNPWVWAITFRRIDAVP